jgi:protein-disulfide isomerase
MVEDSALPELVLPEENRDNCLGPPSARYSLVEYGDYESPHCRHVAGIVRELVRELGDDLCFVFRNYPQPKLHPHSQAAAEAAEAAGLHGKFWLMHDRLLDHQDELTSEAIRSIALGLPIDMAEFERDLATGVAQRRVAEDVESAIASGVGDTPTFFVNGVLNVGAYEFLPLLTALRTGHKGEQGVDSA